MAEHDQDPHQTSIVNHYSMAGNTGPKLPTSVMGTVHMATRTIPNLLDPDDVPSARTTSPQVSDNDSRFNGSQRDFERNLGSENRLDSEDQTSVPSDMQLSLTSKTVVGDGTCKVHNDGAHRVDASGGDTLNTISTKANYLLPVSDVHSPRQHIAPDVTVQSDCRDVQMSAEQALRVPISNDCIPRQHIMPGATEQSNYRDVQMSTGMPHTLYQPSAQQTLQVPVSNDQNPHQHIGPDATGKPDYGDGRMPAEAPHAPLQMSVQQDITSGLTKHSDYGDVQVSAEAARDSYQSVHGDVRMSAEGSPAPYHTSAQQAAQRVHAPAFHNVDVRGEGHKSTTHLCSDGGVQQTLEQHGRESCDSIPNDVQNWFHHFEVMGGRKGLVAYQNVFAAIDGSRFSSSASRQAWNTVDVAGHGWLDLRGFARFLFLMESNQHLQLSNNVSAVGNTAENSFPCPSNAHTDTMRYSQDQPSVHGPLMGNESLHCHPHQLQLNDPFPRQNSVTTISSGFPHSQVDSATSATAPTNFAYTPLAPVGTTVNSRMGQNPKNKQIADLTRFEDVASFQFQQPYQRQQTIVDSSPQSNLHVAGDLVEPFQQRTIFFDDPRGRPVVPSMLASQRLVSGGPSTGIPRHPATDDTYRVPVCSASRLQQTAFTSQGSQPNQRLTHDPVGLARGPITVQSALPPAPQYQPVTTAQSMSNRPAVRTRETNQPQEVNTGKGRQTVNNSQGVSFDLAKFMYP
ncbi:hypothetical protein EDD15DRAFT_2372401 [Pisolithus albus]|nr:hypothetical protein EDD15DRAFT_2372401 [Pisolithus albus]